MTGMAAGDINRSRERSAQVNFRLSPEARDELKRRAQAHGLSVQAYLEHLLLGIEEPEIRYAGRPHKHQQELPLTG